MQNSNTLPLDAEIATEYTSIHAIADNNPTAPMQVGFTTDLAELPHEGGVDPAFGTITWRTLISGENGRSDGVVLGVATCGPNGCLHLHRHDPAEFYLGLSGTGTVTIDGVAPEIRQGIACVKHQNMSGSDIGDDHKEYFAGEAALKAGGKDNTMNQF